MNRSFFRVLIIPLLIASILALILSRGLTGSRDADRLYAQEPESERVEREVSVKEILQEMEALGRKRGYYNISPVDGLFLKTLVTMSDARRVLEIGSANGYSAIWMGLGLEETGGRLITIEINGEKAAEAEENLKRAGLGRIVTVIHGDAFEVIPTLEGTFDFVFLDAWKRDYYAFYKLIIPILEEGGVLVADNAILFADSMRDFLDAVTQNPQLATSIVELDGNDGFAISYKKRTGKTAP